jgi:biopolymer transport protein ExbD
MNKKNLIISILSRRKRLKIIKERKEESTDSSSIGDIAFLLLIFFIVTSSFILRQGIFLSLPSKNAAASKVKENLIVEVVPKNSGFIVDGEFLNRKIFKKKLQIERQKSKDIVLLVRMKDDVKYDRLIDALSVAKESGVERVSLKN